jgi:hypothetical protein
MADKRRAMGHYVSLLILVAATTALSLSAADAGPLMRVGRPILVILVAVLFSLGRRWARWLLLMLSIGAILAGPLSVANGIAPWYLAGFLSWTMSLICLLAMIAIFRGAPAEGGSGTPRPGS